MANIFELPSKDGVITPEKARKLRLIATNAVLRQNSVCLGYSLSMRSFAIDEPGSSVRALNATLLHKTSDFERISPYLLIKNPLLKTSRYNQATVRNLTLMQAEVVKQVQAGHRQNSEDKRTGGALTWHCWVCAKSMFWHLLNTKDKY